MLEFFFEFFQKKNFDLHAEQLANSPKVAKLHFLPCSGQLLPLDFLSLVSVMSHYVVPSFRMGFR
jgi:hypothetical protein